LHREREREISVMSPRPAKRARKAFWLAKHWKLALAAALVLGPLVAYSWHSCSKSAEGCTAFSVVAGVVRILARPFT